MFSYIKIPYLGRLICFGVVLFGSSACSPAQIKAIGGAVDQAIASKEERDQENPSIGTLSPVYDPDCSGDKSITVTMPISMDDTHAKHVAGDGEIDSDDWTELSLVYEVFNTGNAVFMNTTWTSQELNRNKSKGDTRFESTKKVKIWELPFECSTSRIVRVSSSDFGRNDIQSAYIRGSQHGFVGFDDYKNLKDIAIRFDGSGKSDRNKQALTASYDGELSVTLAAE